MDSNYYGQGGWIMPVFVVKQIITHPKVDKVIEKITHIVGRDLGHAIDCVRVPEPMKKDLRKKYWTQTTDIRGRTITIDITEELKV